MYKIDSHHHFWTYNPGEYGWITDKMAVIRRNFGPADLEREISEAEISAVISVQARQSLEETSALLQFAEKHDFIRGVVGWAPFTESSVSEVVAQFSSRAKLRGLRHVLHDEPDPNYVLRPDFNRGIAALKPFGLTYDILIFERHLPQTIQFVDGHPDQVFVVDHLAKPRVQALEISPWAERLRELAKWPNVYCKISGLATEADYHDWTEEQLKRILISCWMCLARRVSCLVRTGRFASLRFPIKIGCVLWSASAANCRNPSRNGSGPEPLLKRTGCSCSTHPYNKSHSYAM